MTEGDPTGGGRAPTEEELRAAMEEQMRRLRVQDVLLQTVVTLVNLSGRRLGLAEDAESERDLEQARLAIEATRALVPLLAPDEARAVKDALSQLQVAFARETREKAAPAGGEPGGAGGEGAPVEGGGEATGAARGEPPPAGAERQGGPTPEEVERARARSRIWTPPGS